MTGNIAPIYYRIWKYQYNIKEYIKNNLILWMPEVKDLSHDDIPTGDIMPSDCKWTNRLFIFLLSIFYFSLSLFYLQSAMRQISCLTLHFSPLNCTWLRAILGKYFNHARMKIVKILTWYGFEQGHHRDNFDFFKMPPIKKGKIGRNVTL